MPTEGPCIRVSVVPFCVCHGRIADLLEGLAKPMKAAGAGGGSSMGPSSSLRTAVGAALPDKMHSLALQGAESSILDGTLTLLEVGWTWDRGRLQHQGSAGTRALLFQSVLPLSLPLGKQSSFCTCGTNRMHPWKLTCWSSFFL